MKEYIVKCDCGKSFNAADQIEVQISKGLKDEFNAKWQIEKSKLDEAQARLDQEKADLAAQIQQKATEQAQIQIAAIKELTDKQLNDQKLESEKRLQESIALAQEHFESKYAAEAAQLKTEKARLEEKANQAQKFEEKLRLKEIQFEALEQQNKQELEQATQRATAAAQMQFDLEKQRLQNEIESQKLNLEAEKIALSRQLEKQSQEKLEQERIKLVADIKAEEERKAKEESQRLRSEYEEKIRLKDEQINQQARMAQGVADVANRKSQQLQGESFEQHIKRIFTESFYPNPVSDIKTGGGQTGADLRIDYIDGQTMIKFPVIFELKNTQSFSNSWIDKLKKDAAQIPNALPIILTKSMPKNSEDAFLILEDILVVKYDEDGHFLPSVKLVILQFVKQIQIRNSLSNLDGKMEQTYQLLMSDAFKNRLSSVVTFFENRRKFLTEEKKFFAKKWKNEEKELNAISAAAIEIQDNITYIQSGMQSISEMGAHLLGESTHNALLIEDSSTEEDQS